MAAVAKFKPTRDPAEIPFPMPADNPRYQAKLAEIAQREQRLAEAEKRERVAHARLSGQPPTRNLADRARDLVAGGRVSATDPAAEINAAQDEQRTLKHDLNVKREELNAIVGDLAYELQLKLRAFTDEAQRNVLAGAEIMFQGLEVVRTIYARLIAAGYPHNSTAMPIVGFSAAVALGDPARCGTQANMYREALIAKGIL
jgi:hypothetical protein